MIHKSENHQFPSLRIFWLQDLLWSAHEVEVEKEKQLKKLFNALDAKFPSKDEAPTQVS